MLVVKCGGNATVDPEAVCEDVAALHELGHRIVMVHGGSADIDMLATRLGVPIRRMAGAGGASARHTDQATLEVVQLALAGAVKPRLVTALARHGVQAVGLTGLDAALLQARRISARRAIVDGRPTAVRDLHSGRIVGVNSQLLQGLLDQGLVPVVSPPALAEDGAAVNCDADRAAAAIAVVLGASSLVLLTGAPGLLSDPSDEDSVLPEFRADAAVQDFAGGGMAAKLMAARDAVLGGVAEVRIADGRRRRPVSEAMAGGGTRVIVGPPMPHPRVPYPPVADEQLLR